MESSNLSPSVPNYCQHDMQFYDNFAAGLMDLRALEKLCIERMTILAIVLRIAAKNERKTPKERREEFVTELRKERFKAFAELCDGKGCEINTKERQEARKIDNVMHNILCLVFHRDMEIREWLMKAETFLFRWRLEALNDEGIAAFRAINNMLYERVEMGEKKRLKSDLVASIDDPSAFAKTTFYKVPVLEMLDVIKHKKIYFQKGQAYIIESHFRSLIDYHYRRRFSSKLQKSIGIDYFLGGDQRIDDLAKYLRKIYESLQPRAWHGDLITADKLEELSKTFFPPCMRNIHEGLKRDHHLRNGGRLHYTVFLKAIGVPVEEAVKFYREEFTKRFNDNEFDKEFLYQFRHMYGLLGSKKNYEPRDCVDMAAITRTHAFDHHGCFFAPPDIEDFGKKLIDWKIPQNYREKIYTARKNKEYGKACCIYFEATHKRPLRSALVKPHDFYKHSKKIRDIKIEYAYPEVEENQEEIQSER